MTPAIFFSLLIIAVAFLPVFALTGQAGRLFKPLAYTKTFVMLVGGAPLDHVRAGAARPAHPRQDPPGDRTTRSRAFIIALYEPFVYVALRQPEVDDRDRPLRACSRRSRSRSRLGSEFMPPLNEGDMLYMPITFPEHLDRGGEAAAPGARTASCASFPEVRTVFGKVGRAETPTDPAPLSMVETIVRLKPPRRVAQGAPRALVLGLGARLARSRSLASRLARGAADHLGRARSPR